MNYELEPREQTLPNDKSKTALCILTRFYNAEWIQLLESFNHYDVFLVIDDNSTIYENEPEKKVKIVQVDESLCMQNNYYKSSTWSNLKEIISWDKALYYFNFVEKDYQHVWFIEDDVFFYNEDTIMGIDQKYPHSDLLTKFHEVNEKGDVHQGWNHWVNVIHRIGTPWAHSLVCACRLSRRLLDRVDAYLDDRPFMFIEALFNTLALHYHYRIDNPTEMSGITYDYKWKDEEIVDKQLFYHPIKTLERHKLLRTAITDKNQSL